MQRIHTLPPVAIFALLVSAVSTEIFAAPTYSFQSGRRAGTIDRVVSKLEVGGETVGKDEQGKPLTSKLSVVANFDYDEKALQVPAGKSDRIRTVRFYNNMDVAVKIGKKARTPMLRDDRHLIAADYNQGKLTLFSPRGRLTRDELSLIDVLGNSILLDYFLPTKRVAVGSSWKLPETLVAAVFGLGTVSTVDVTATLKEVTPTVARFEASGHIEGTFEGVATKIDVKAKYRFDRRMRRIDWMGLLAKEVRPSGIVADGVDVVAKFQIQVAPKKSSPQLTATALKGFTLTPTSALTQLTYRHDVGGWQFTNDRRWHIVADTIDMANLRLLDDGKVLAQCTVTSRISRDPTKKLPLAEFREDVQKALGKNCKEVVRAKEATNAAGYRVFQVICRGVVKDDSELEKTPIQWHYYYLTDKLGRQVVFAFTIEQNLVAKVDSADANLVHSLRFIDNEIAEPDPS